ncbi:MAG: ATP phosphoribosyltransferase regulatory subunit [Gammaproteobacteria bacterium]|nr:ATP phosphoribosyltransferase regulatory subunit [Gammaproteobacteria bacterium]
MSLTNRWLLPEGIDENLPPEAERIERLRRRLLDLLASWGYELVMPPLIEYLESLLTGLGTDLDLQTFKLTDQLSGRMMGVRADMTPQVARIDAHRLGRDVPTRLCYLGTVLHTRAGSVDSSRNPLQLGAELYGHGGIESDVEVLCLLLAVLHEVGAPPVCVNASHIGVFRGLVERAGLDAERRTDLFDMLQRKAVPELREQLLRWQVEPQVRAMIEALPDLNGGTEVLERARGLLAGAGAGVASGIEEIALLAGRTAARRPDATFHFDLAEMRGFNYHTGIMFEAFVPGWGRAVAWGGRYDDVGRVFGRARPATGFSTDLKLLARFASDERRARSAVFAPPGDDRRLLELIARLRASGERVIAALPGQSGDATAMGCDRRIEEHGGHWRVVDV